MHIRLPWPSASAPSIAAPPNGLAIIAPNDHFTGIVEDMHHVATSVNATTATIDDAGHWWICSHPEQADSILIEHLAPLNAEERL